MYALDKVDDVVTPQSIVIKYIHVYKKAGLSEAIFDNIHLEDKIYHNLSKKDDIFYAYRILFKDSPLTDARLETIINKNGNCELKNQNEIILKNLIALFNKLDNSDGHFYPYANFISDLLQSLFEGTKLKPKFRDKKPNEDKRSRELLQDICDKYSVLKKRGMVEYGYLNTSLFMDMISLDPFTFGNMEIALLLLYILIINSDISVFRYVSFFKMLYERMNTFNNAINNAKLMYEIGYPNLFPILAIILDIESKALDELERIQQSKKFDKELPKAKIIETIIYALPKQFKKSDIREEAPNISDSTIDRVLSELSREGKIMAFDSGRNASWVRIDETHDNKYF